MKKVLLILFVVILLITLILWNESGVVAPEFEPIYVAPQNETSVTTDAPLVTVIAQNLTVPWEVVFLPDGELLVTERLGRIQLIKEGVELPVSDILSTGEGGLLGATLHPNFSDNHWLYLYQTTQDGIGLKNRVVRYEFRENKLLFNKVIVDELPGAIYHDGGRIEFGPDGYLYVTVGDALRPKEAANPVSFQGTILKMTDEGTPAPENPFNSLVYSFGHRNAQGIAWDDAGRLWSSEHGRSVGGSGFDEINLITRGGNYGWPDSQGDTVMEGTLAPAHHSGAHVTWAPGDLAYHNGSLYMTGLRGETLYEAVLDETEIVAWYEHFIGEFGRLRTVSVGQDGLLYVTTSNRDGRLEDGPAQEDDRLLRINPTKLIRK